MKIEKDCTDTSNQLTTYISNIFETGSKLACPGEEMSDSANFYYCPEFTKNFKELCFIFVTWTSVMRDLFFSTNEVGTSARSERFMRTKQKIPRPISIVKFLLIEKRRIICFTNYEFMHVPKMKNVTLKNKNENGTNKKRSIAFSTSTTNFTAQIACNKRFLIRNGMLLSLKDYEIENTTMKLVFTNTCPFDSITEIVCTMCIDDSCFRQDLKELCASRSSITFFKMTTP